MSVGVTYPRGFRAAGISAGLKPSGRPTWGCSSATPARRRPECSRRTPWSRRPSSLSRARIAAGAGTAAFWSTAGRRTPRPAHTATTMRAPRRRRPRSTLGLAAADVAGVLHRGDRRAGAHGAAARQRLRAWRRRSRRTAGAPSREAIMTTDTVAKEATAGAGRIRVGGAAKGVGMLAPNLATMLAFVTTDARVAHAGPRPRGARPARPGVRSDHRRRLHQHERHRAAVRERRGRRLRRSHRTTRDGRRSPMPSPRSARRSPVS